MRDFSYPLCLRLEPFTSCEESYKFQSWQLVFSPCQVKEGMFDKEKFDDLCWMMTMKKNYKGVPKGSLLLERDCFKLFCLFNLLSEDRYPLVMIPEEVKETDVDRCVSWNHFWIINFFCGWMFKTWFCGRMLGGTWI